MWLSNKNIKKNLKIAKRQGDPGNFTKRKFRKVRKSQKFILTDTPLSRRLED